MKTITEDQARELIRRSKNHGYAKALCDVHALLGSQMQHADSAAEAEMLNSIGNALLEMARRL